MRIAAATSPASDIAARAAALTLQGRSFCRNARGGAEDRFAVDGFGFVLLAAAEFDPPALPRSPTDTLSAVDWLSRWCDPVRKPEPGDLVLIEMPVGRPDGQTATEPHVAVFVDTGRRTAQIAHAYPVRAPGVSWYGPWWSEKALGFYRPRPLAPAAPAALALQVAA